MPTSAKPPHAYNTEWLCGNHLLVCAQRRLSRALALTADLVALGAHDLASSSEPGPPALAAELDVIRNLRLAQRRGNVGW